MKSWIRQGQENQCLTAQRKRFSSFFKFIFKTRVGDVRNAPQRICRFSIQVTCCLYMHCVGTCVIQCQGHLIVKAHVMFVGEVGPRISHRGTSWSLEVQETATSAAAQTWESKLACSDSLSWFHQAAESSKIKDAWKEESGQQFA